MIDLNQKHNRLQMILTVFGITDEDLQEKAGIALTFRSHALNEARQTEFPNDTKIDNLIGYLHAHYQISPDLFDTTKTSNVDFWTFITEEMSDNPSLAIPLPDNTVVQLTHDGSNR